MVSVGPARRQPNLVAGIGTANSNEHLIFRRQRRDNVPLAFAAVLTSDEHINETDIPSPVQAEVASHSDLYVQFRRPLRINIDVGQRSEGLYLLLGGATIYVGERVQFADTPAHGALGCPSPLTVTSL